MVKQDIIVKGLELFSKNGYKATTVDAIATELKISKKTFYKFFDTKEEFIVEVVRFQRFYFEQLAQEWSNKSDDVIDFFFSFLKYCDELSGFISKTETVDEIHLHYKNSIKEYESLTRGMLLDFIMPVIERCEKEGLLDKEIDKEVYANMYMNQYLFLRTTDSFRNEHKMKDVFNQTYYMFFKGMLNAKGVALLESKEYRLMIAP